MTKSSLVSHYLRQLFLTLGKQVRILRVHPTEEDALHEFRLQIKRLRALLYFLNTVIPDKKPLKLPRTLKNIFRASGFLRDLQVQRKVVQDFFPEPWFVSFLKTTQPDWDIARKKIKSVLKAYSQHATRVFFQRLFRRLSHLKISSLPNLSLPLVQAKLELAVQALSCETPALHEIRIHLKKSQYLLEILVKYFHLEDIIHDSFDRLKKITARLGIWHDQEVFALYLQRQTFEDEEGWNQKFIRQHLQASALLATELSEQIPDLINALYWQTEEGAYSHV